MEKERILILGGGFAKACGVRRLEKQFAYLGHVDVALASREMPMLQPSTLSKEERIAAKKNHA
jgi:hypothetical protein